ncbi:MAG: FecCD family ABC transporter permease [Tropicimonas sp.]|uniref:FecCD family ABC transporter permease n=1 Tax=Tropicimonas sp. TaxID=2067044 RepID=UPI003A8BCB70
MSARTETDPAPAAMPGRAFRPEMLIWILAPPLVGVLSFLIGRYPVEPWTVVQVLAAQVLPIPETWSATVETVVIDVRLPRVLGALCVGGCLSLSGAVYQGVFRNPLVSEFTLGVSAGAGFGAALAILLVNTRWAVQGSAFLFALLAVGVCFGLSRAYRARSILVLVLCGIIVGSVFSSLLTLLKFVADPESKLPVIEYWLMGSLSSVSMGDALSVLALALPAATVILALRWRLNVLALGDDEARLLGMEPFRMRLTFVLCATLMAAAAVSISGIIGWVGLVIPHFARMLVGPDFRRLLPASLSIGACYLLVVDNIARSVTQAEVPLGILTALVGAPFFAVLLKRSFLGWN